jgi:hypothetical protein
MAGIGLLLAATATAAADQVTMVCDGGPATGTAAAGNPVPLPGPISVLYDTATQKVLSLGDAAGLDVVTDAFSSKAITAHENVDALHMVRTFTLDRSKATFVLKWDAPASGIAWVWQGNCIFPSHQAVLPN